MENEEVEKESYVLDRETKQQPISASRIAANRLNAQKSTGPTSEIGKSRSRFNALKHGLLAKHFCSTDKLGEAEDSTLLTLLDDLRARYGRDDVHVELLLEQLVVDYRRNAKALALESEYVDRGPTAFHSQGSISTFERYINSNRRSMLKIMSLLQSLRQPRKGEDADR